MKRFLSIVIIIFSIFELLPVNALTEQRELKIGVMGVFVDGKEDTSLSSIVAPLFSTSNFFNWERIGRDTPISIYWGIATFDVKFKHNTSNVSANVKLIIKDTRTNVDMFILETNALSSPFTGVVLDWKPLEKEAFLNAIGTLSKRLDDIWRFNSIVTYAEENVFESDLGKDIGIVEGTVLSVFRGDKLIAKGKVTSLNQKTCKAEVTYEAENEYPRLGDVVRIGYIPPSPEVSFINQATPILNAVAGIAILAGLVALYNVAKANMTSRITLISPENGDSFKPGEPITFSWTTNDNSIKIFKIRVSGKDIPVGSDTSYTYTAPSASSSYDWKVIGYREDGSSVESETRTFIVAP